MSFLFKIDSLYEGNGPIKIPVIKPEMTKPNPQLGIGMMAWSFDSNFLATRNGILHDL